MLEEVRNKNTTKPKNVFLSTFLLIPEAQSILDRSLHAPVRFYDPSAFQKVTCLVRMSCVGKLKGGMSDTTAQLHSPLCTFYPLGQLLHIHPLNGLQWKERCYYSI